MKPTLAFLPTNLPFGWKDVTKDSLKMLAEHGVPLLEVKVFVYTLGKPRQVFVGLEEHNNRPWIHLSVSYGRGATHVPSWEVFTEAKRLFLGNRRGVQIFPKEEEYVNFHEVLHIYSPYYEEDWPLPDFRIGGMV